MALCLLVVEELYRLHAGLYDNNHSSCDDSRGFGADIASRSGALKIIAHRESRARLVSTRSYSRPAFAVVCGEHTNTSSSRSACPMARVGGVTRSIESKNLTPQGSKNG